ncbi:DUF1127 domain-containing protein [Rhodospirillum rubrum]|uniref:YjiS-like domain-containing protein n=1 Tax=Rhodospirillum rubrum (strain ATCC 11170 / ATH 1.1.1 / DSM 467 / LMG 4362 / NCIMB 8255 / S1) TaxID=269796 RepID=Q2RNY2_RHORT|nr:DUF1127 domain-containing protein [Rhodospirillum rubrum]ABC24163.1 hypothetical protein Rru_A3369 [Rhodospirillum rubrum ATCC 11170]AEO49914.1 hypothetical protein F11_17270 [Rhodospirillum rubrum F11]MBK5955876.1 hypothetical protein [Rhodospirillum rubrum]QXG80103.1 DUF1127 domain-containing protein [Rhodospirillum rubrum]HCF18942.1 DUF1127 domain-containing protein [Rhodospirillum rubrum]
MFAPNSAYQSVWSGSLFSQAEWWLVRQFDRLADRRERHETAALLGGLDDRMLADIGYGIEDDYRTTRG